MGQEPDELRRDIERRRDELGETIDAIGDRVSPGRIIERRRNRMTDGVRQFRDRVMGTVSSGTDTIGDVAGNVRDHVGPDAVREQTAGSPLGAGLVAFGIGFLVAAAFPATEPEIAVADRATDALEPAKDAALESVRNVADDVKQGAAVAAQQVKADATDAAGTVVEDAKHQAAAAKEDAQQAAQR
ncbi:MAG TPA: DUF3618 domain-containing protein [Ilumatobacteraceae bacterium]|nr:DUF3618 domain-containing protein [Ilumatobacteraceae bacterium]